MLEQDVISAHAQIEHHVRAVYIINALHALELSFTVYELFLAARSAPSQLCLYYDTACSGCNYMMECIEQVQQGGREVSPPACNL